MRPWIASLVVFGLLGACSAAAAQWTYVVPAAVPAPVVYGYWPAAPVAAVAPVTPVYVYRPGAVTVYRPAPVTVYRPAVVAVPPVPVVPEVAAPAPLDYTAPLYPAPVLYPAPAVIRTKVFYRGEPVRNAIKAVLP